MLNRLLNFDYQLISQARPKRLAQPPPPELGAAHATALRAHLHDLEALARNLNNPHPYAFSATQAIVIQRLSNPQIAVTQCLQ